MYPDIDAKVLEFYCEARSKNMPVNGGLLKAKALAIAKDLNYQIIKFFSIKWLARLFFYKTSTKI